MACKKPTILYCNNKSTISIVHNLIQHDKTKHIDIDQYFIKERMDSDLITISYVTFGLWTSVSIFVYKKVFQLRFHDLTTSHTN